MKAILIPFDGPPREIDLPGYDDSQIPTQAVLTTCPTAVPNCAEQVWITDRWEAWLDEDGMAAGKPANQAATLLAQSFGWQLSLRGTIVPFVGEVPESGLGSSADGKGEDGIDRSFEGTGAPMHLGE